MTEKIISTDRAILMGQLFINLPVTLLIIGIPSLSFFIDKPDLKIVLLLILAGFLSAWLFWSIAIVQWRLWAFEKIEDPIELMEDAVAGKLIWPEGSFFEKTEIATKKQKEKLNLLYQKPLQPKLFTQPYSKETKIYFSKKTLIVSQITWILMICCGLYLFTEDGNNFSYILATVFIIYAIYELNKARKKLKNKSVQLTLDNDGIRFTNENKIKWQSIYDFRIAYNYNTKAHNLQLELKHETKVIDISLLNISSSKLKSLIIMYRSNYNQSL